MSDKKRFRFLLFWWVTIELYKPELSPFELTPQDRRWWSLDAALARLERDYPSLFGKRIALPTITPTETPLLVSKPLPSRRAGKREAVTKTVKASVSDALPVCTYCGKPFHGRRADAKFCTPAHRQASWKEQKKAAAAIAA